MTIDFEMEWSAAGTSGAVEQVRAVAARHRKFLALQPEARIAALRGKRQERFLRLDRGAIDEEARTVTLSISSEASYERWWGFEILDHGRGSIRDMRLEAGFPLLVGHDARDHVGVGERWEVTSDRKLQVTARFGRSARAEEIWRDVLDGIRTNASVGYLIHDLVLERQEEGVSTYRVIDWEPLEGSLVSVPADPSVGVGRQLFSHAKGFIPMTIHDDAGDAGNLSRRERRILRAGGELEAREFDDSAARERQRVADILRAGNEFVGRGGPEIAAAVAAEPSGTVEMFRQRMLGRLSLGTPPLNTAEPAYVTSSYGAGAREQLPLPKHFKGPDAQARAFAAGQWLRALYGDRGAIAWCGANGLEVRAMSGQILSQGGALVPDQLSATIIDLADSHGVFRMRSDVWPMNTDTLTVPRSASDPEVNFVEESAEIPDSEGAWETVNLVARKAASLVRVPTELMDDSPIAIADRVAFQIGRAFAKKEDECGFLGDATSTYGGMRGVFHLLVDGSHDGGQVLAGANHDTFAEIDAADLAALVAALPEVAYDGAGFYCSHRAWGLTFFRILQGLAGNAVSDLAGDIPKAYGGFPVYTSPVLPAGATTDYSGQVMIAFGNLRLASKLGLRRDIRLQILTERYAEFDQIGIKATERFHALVHDIGDATTAGPLVGLIGN
ncbi:MAG: phage major capsid protein [Burkholderiales bacterium]|nr:phage major capsid protein [Burkholderiales bacterium]